MNQFLMFLSNFLKNPKSVGAVVPLSPSVTRELIKYIAHRDRKKSSRILEAGAGIGNISSAIVKTLEDQDHFDIVEIDRGCCDVLNKNFANDPRVAVQCMSIMDWHPEKSYDFIISTLPFNMFPPAFIENIFNHYRQLLAKGGTLTYVEYIGLQKINLALSKGEKKKEIADRLELLKKFHDKYLIEKKSVMTNFLPCHIYHLRFS